MCYECDRDVEIVRPSLDALIESERQCQSLYRGDSQAQHTIRLACAIVDGYHESGHDTRTLAIGFSLAIQKLIAVQEVYGIPTV